MEKRHDTTMGGERSAFQTTHWSEIRNAKTRDKALRKVIVENLMRRYWRPVYCYLRHRGYANEAAKDLTQGFFHEIVLRRELIQQADQAKGRFRTFLLTALDRYVTDMHRKETASKRSPTRPIVRFGEINGTNEVEMPAEATPDEAFLYTWASGLLDEVLAKVKDECYSTGKATHWQVFHAKILAPIIGSAAPLSLTDICTKYGVDSESKASNMVVTVKRRFRAVLRHCLRKFVQSDSEIEEELSELIEILSKNTAR